MADSDRPDRYPAERLTAEETEIGRRLDLRASVIFARHVRETRIGAEHVDARLTALCLPIERLGEDAVAALREIPDSPRLVEADRAFLATKSLSPERERHAIAAEMARLAAPLLEYLHHSGGRGKHDLDRPPILSRPVV